MKRQHKYRVSMTVTTKASTMMRSVKLRGADGVRGASSCGAIE